MYFSKKVTYLLQMQMKCFTFVVNQKQSIMAIKEKIMYAQVSVKRMSQDVVEVYLRIDEAPNWASSYAIGENYFWFRPEFYQDFLTALNELTGEEWLFSEKSLKLLREDALQS